MECNCLALRKAARRVTNFYDAELAPAGLRTTQFSILAIASRNDEMTVSALADRLALDRTTAGKNLRPLEAARLIKVAPLKTDRRVRAISITPAGREKFLEARPLWLKAQTRFETLNGAQPLAALRATLKNIQLD